MTEATMIPHADRYAIEPGAGVVHRAYVEHAAALPRTTRRGIASYTDTPVICDQPGCWPATTAPPEPMGYYCLRCERRHVEGSAIHDAHLVVEDEPEAESGEGTDDGDTGD